MGFIEKYLETRESEKFVIDKNIALKYLGVFIFILLILGYLTLSYFHSLSINKKMFYVYFFHYHFPHGAAFFILFSLFPVVFYSLILLVIFIGLFFKFKNKRSVMLNYWIFFQLLIVEHIAVSYYSSEPIQDHTVWSFIDCIIHWNIVFNIFVPILPILILIKIFKK